MPVLFVLAVVVVGGDLRGAGDGLAGSGLQRLAWRHLLTLASDQDYFGSDSQLKGVFLRLLLWRRDNGSLGLILPPVVLWWFCFFCFCKGFVVLCFYSINTHTTNFLPVPFKKKR